MTNIRTILWHVLALSSAAPMLNCASSVGPLDASSDDAGVTSDLQPTVDVGTLSDVQPAVDQPLCDASVTQLSGCNDGTLVTFACGLPPGLSPGTFDIARCEALCNPFGRPTFGPWQRCFVTEAREGRPATLQCIEACVVDGRRPEGFTVPPSPAGSTPLQAHFAASAALESAAVSAFERLADELAHHGAAADLVDRARASADDERRHTRLMTALAARYGVTVTPARPTVGPPRALVAIARENAVEGCVRETYAALLALWQATHARDPAVARVLRVIADDETRHAQLAWDVAGWIEPQLDADARARLDEERAAAVATLRREMTGPVPPSLVEGAGVPDPASAARLIAGLDANLFRSGVEGRARDLPAHAARD